MPKPEEDNGNFSNNPFSLHPPKKKGGEGTRTWKQEQIFAMQERFCRKRSSNQNFRCPLNLSTLLDSSAPDCISDRLRSSALAVCHYEFQCLATCI
ncbi:hypothetical protein CEXT_385671 [Caerostris extrusa]|uniref:Uncharacterized protein n=1 Tax=Caerostris extrusa TaxID=172846 RepID=A0AAV4S2G7_CAEEX|nr:hypothetical protein CEXT_385671 [Caerostris extrusa]